MFVQVLISSIDCAFWFQVVIEVIHPDLGGSDNDLGELVWIGMLDMAKVGKDSSGYSMAQWEECWRARSKSVATYGLDPCSGHFHLY